MSLEGIPMTEVHALHFKDDDNTRAKLVQLLDDNNLAFSHSVRQPLIIFGQDEAIFKQYLMQLKVWLGRGGKQPLRPKDDGQGLMVSAMKCREFGFGFDLTPQQLAIVNIWRATHRPNYLDRAAATKVHGSHVKEPLTTSPFMTIFDYGKNADGYWTYDRMVCQLEDCHDALDGLHSTRATHESEQRHMTVVPHTTSGDVFVRNFDTLFLFDHSNGHDRKKPDGLDINGLTKGPSAKAKKMRDTIVENVGPYSHPFKLEVGMTQRLVFGEFDPWGNPETGPILKGSYKRKFDDISGYTEEDKLCDDLRKDLEERAMDTGGVKAKLVARCIQAGIPLKKRVANVKEYGWFGKPIGAFHLLHERGMVSPDVKDQDKYTMKGQKDEHNHIIKETSINHLIRQCEDFVHEKTLLVHYGEMLGSTIDRTPKCTPEIAGDGIEFDWAMSKLWYRKQPWEDKQKKDKFTKLVKDSLSEDVISIVRSRHFSRRARMNMVSYYILERDGKATTPSDVQKYKKKRKSHTSCLDVDRGYISGIVQSLLNNA